LALVLIDIDHFKHINDTLGHTAGDRALTAFAKVCKENIREIDLLGRFGGDELILLMPQTASEQAYEIAERLRLAATHLHVEFDGQPILLTSSFGVASLADEQDTIDSILRRADQALYFAKRSGQNRVFAWNTLLTRGDA
jgi:diguanylate cyclase (GGDEF)-like protein